MTRVDRVVTSLAVAGLLLGVSILAQAHGNEKAAAKAAIGGANITIEYARPMLKGRDLNKMIEPGKLWRIGADIPTTLESDQDLDFGGTRVPKGKHILLARYIEPGRWTLIVSSKSVLQYEPSAKLAEVPLQLETGKDPVEALTINLSNQGGRGVIDIAWGDSRLDASFAPAK
jgi:nucleoid-associated protein YgaU